MIADKLPTQEGRYHPKLLPTVAVIAVVVVATVVVVVIVVVDVVVLLRLRLCVVVVARLAVFAGRYEVRRVSVGHWGVRNERLLPFIRYLDLSIHYPNYRTNRTPMTTI